MSITYTKLNDFSGQFYGHIKNVERLSKQPSDVGDHTVTYGYGYTLIRKADDRWSIYENLGADLATIGITLTKTQTDILEQIADSLNKNLGSTTTHATLITSFRNSLNRPDLTETTAKPLFDAEWGHQQALLEARFKTVLRSVNGSALFTAVKDTKEMVAIASL